MADLEQLHLTLKVRAEQYRSATFRLVLLRRTGGLRLFSGTLIFSNEDAPEDRRLDYDELALWQLSCAPEEALALLDQITSDGPNKLGIEAGQPYTTQRIGNHYGDKLPMPLGRERFAEWPATLFKLSPQRSSHQIPRGPFLSLDLPLVIDPRAYVHDWIGTKNNRWEHEVINGGVLVCFPDYRARLRRVTFTESTVTVEAEIALSRREQVKARASVGKPDELHHEAPVEMQGSKYVVRVSHLPHEFHFFLLHIETGEVLDWALVHPSWAHESPHIEVALPGKQLAHLLDEGENESVEFKREPSLTIVQSIVAFANTKGGVILVGVDDDARVVGVDTQAVEDKVREWMETRCDPPVEVTFEAVEFDAGRVAVIRVPVGSNPPYLHREKGVAYVRRGSTDRPARRAEMDDLYGRQSGRVEVLRRPFGLRPW